MADDVTPLRKSIDPMTDSSGTWAPPDLGYGLKFRDYGSLGLRQFGGWVREEFEPDLVGKQAARTYREMLDNSSIVGAMVFAIQQAMRQVQWRVEPASDKAEDQKFAEFVESLKDDMSHTWDDFLVEALSMLGYGYSIHELVYKRRLGRQPNGPGMPPSSSFNDGLVGWRRLPIRGQDTVLKWFFDENGMIQGVTQQPWTGTLIDIPIEKLLLFRPFSHKGNPEGRSILRTAYRSWYFVKRLEEQEAVLLERMGGFPVVHVPSALIEAAAADDNPSAKATLEAYKKLVSNVRIDEQMGAVLPSDPYRNADGNMIGIRMYDFRLETPQHGRSSVNTNQTIERHKVDMLTTVLADFLKMGHDARGAHNLAVTKSDMFYGAIEGWLHSVADVLNRYALPRTWEMNGFDQDKQPKFIPELPHRLDLDALGNFVKNIALAGMPLFPDEELEEFIRDQAGMPVETSPEAQAAADAKLEAAVREPTPPNNNKGNGADKAQKALLGAVFRKMREMRLASGK